MENCIELKKDIAEFIKNKAGWDDQKAYTWLNTNQPRLGASPETLIRQNQGKKVFEFVKTEFIATA